MNTAHHVWHFESDTVERRHRILFLDKLAQGGHGFFRH